MTIAAALTLGGCSGGTGVTFLEEPSVPDLAWPSPPDSPRIRYLGSLTGPEDLGQTRSFFRRIWDFVAGGEERRILQPYGVTVDAEGRIYVCDSAQRSVHIFDVERRDYRVIRGPSGEGFRFPVGVAVAGDRVFISDSEAARVGAYQRDGDLDFSIEGDLVRPSGLAVDSVRGLLYVADPGRHEVLVYDLDGRFIRAFGGRGGEPGRFNFPTNVAVAPDGRLLVTDALNFRVQIFGVDGQVERVFGDLGDGLGDLARPKGIGLDSEGHVYVVEGLYDVVNVYEEDGRHLLTFGGPGVSPGQFWLATGLAMDARDRIYVADSYNGRIQVFQYLGPTP